MSDHTPSQLGDYDLLEVLHETEDTQTFVARQRSIDRKVALVLLKPHRCEDERAVESFRQDIKAKACVTHPRIAAVYESSEQDGRIFYTREIVAGKDIMELRAEGHRFPASFVWSLLRTLCETFLYYEKNQLGYRPFQPAALVLIHEEPYVANLATAEPSDPDVFEKSLAAIRESFWRLFRAEDTHVEDVRRLFSRMDPDHARVYRGWEELQRACNIVSQAVTAPAGVALPAGSPVSTGAGEAAAAYKEERSYAAAQATSRFLTVITMLLLGVAAAAAWWWWYPERAVEPAENPMVQVPAGPFVYQEGQTLDLGEFWISKYEITIAQYAAFLDYLKGSKAFDHADQPDSKEGHIPEDWEAYYAAAEAQSAYRGQPLNINCPVVGVDWWDAYAYARWRGGRLPRADEWEKAGRGGEGFLFPWGREPDSSKANTGLDYDKAAGAGGTLDGFNAWAPVDQLGADVSPFGVVGMGGNVSEWTATLGTDPNNPGREVPVVKGASFVTKSQLDLTHGRLPSPDKGAMSRGFRIAADAVR